MSDTTGPRPTPLTEIEKAELLDAIPGNLPLRQTMRRVLLELDFNRADLATLRAENEARTTLVNQLNDKLIGYGAEIYMECRRREAAEAENATLRAQVAECERLRELEAKVTDNRCDQVIRLTAQVAALTERLANLYPKGQSTAPGLTQKHLTVLRLWAAEYQRLGSDPAIAPNLDAESRKYKLLFAESLRALLASHDTLLRAALPADAPQEGKS